MQLAKLIYKNDVIQPPLLFQGSKLKLIPFILANIEWNGRGTYYEPFLGSGVVAFNIQPPKAVLSDTNPHLIGFYQNLQDEKKNMKEWEELLWEWKTHLSNQTVGYEFEGKEMRYCEYYYYKKRAEFNKTKRPELLFLLNLSCYHRLMRFNNKGEFNVGFMFQASKLLGNVHDKKGRALYNILSQLKKIRAILLKNECTLKVCSFTEILPQISKDDLVYLDPPYFERDTNYFDVFTEEENDTFLKFILNHPKLSYVVSNWYSDPKKGINPFIESIVNPKLNTLKLYSHKYYIGSAKKRLTQDVLECLIISNQCRRTTPLGLEKYFKV